MAEIEMKSHGDKAYKVHLGTWYDARTPDEVIQRLEVARALNTRIRIYLGNTETGECWMDEHDTMGTLNRSTGSVKIPLLIHNARSMGAPALLDHCVIAVQSVEGKHFLYKHPKFHLKPMTYRALTDADIARYSGKTLLEMGYTHGVFMEDGSNQANFRSEKGARNYVEFMQGRRMAK